MSSPNVCRGAMAGLVGGLVAAGAMSLAHGLLAAAPRPAPEGSVAPPSREPEPEEEDATVKVAVAVASRLGVPLADADKDRAGSIVHYAFGASVGALYGGLAEVAPIAAAGGGLVFGAAVWLGAHALAVPALGLARSPARQPPAQEAQEFGLHLLYGAVTEMTRRLLRPAARR